MRTVGETPHRYRRRGRLGRTTWNAIAMSTTSESESLGSDLQERASERGRRLLSEIASGEAAAAICVASVGRLGELRSLCTYRTLPQTQRTFLPSLGSGCPPEASAFVLKAGPAGPRPFLQGSTPPQPPTNC